MGHIKIPGGREPLPIDRAVATLEAYWKRNPAVWDLFEKPLVGPRDRFDPLDVLALNALNVGLTMGEMTEFWTSPKKKTAEKLLQEVPSEPLEKLPADGVGPASERLGAVADEIDGVTGWGSTRVAKLLYRMRPRLAPIWDDYIGQYYERLSKASWAKWYAVAMRDILTNIDPLREAIAQTAEPYNRISPVRAFDILLWKPVADARNGAAQQ